MRSTSFTSTSCHAPAPRAGGRLGTCCACRRQVPACVRSGPRRRPAADVPQRARRRRRRLHSASTKHGTRQRWRNRMHSLERQAMCASSRDIFIHPSCGCMSHGTRAAASAAFGSRMHTGAWTRGGGGGHTTPRACAHRHRNIVPSLTGGHGHSGNLITFAGTRTGGVARSGRATLTPHKMYQFWAILLFIATTNVHDWQIHFYVLNSHVFSSDMQHSPAVKALWPRGEYGSRATVREAVPA